MTGSLSPLTEACIVWYVSVHALCWSFTCTSSPHPGEHVQLRLGNGVGLGDIYPAGSAVYWQRCSTKGRPENTTRSHSYQYSFKLKSMNSAKILQDWRKLVSSPVNVLLFLHILHITPHFELVPTLKFPFNLSSRLGK